MSDVPKAGIALALSGGGYRAALFHVGSLWRLNELGILGKLQEVTSVSGGSITAAILGLNWKQLDFDLERVASNYSDVVAEPVRKFCERTIDLRSILFGILNPTRHPSQLISSAYDKHLFRGATLEDLPDAQDGPRFTIYATSLQTGASVRFSKPYLAEFRIGLLRKPTIPLAVAVAASSAFPPPLCPLKIDLNPDAWDESEAGDLYANRVLRSRMLLGDGGIYDNLGLERVWDRYKTVLVSDAGAPMKLQQNSVTVRMSQLARTKRTLDIMSNQTRALRTRRLIEDFESGTTKGSYWGIGTKIDDYGLVRQGKQPAMIRDSSVTEELRNVRTRLNRFSPREQGQLINWGYALADAAVRRYVLDNDPAPGDWPDARYALDRH